MGLDPLDPVNPRPIRRGSREKRDNRALVVDLCPRGGAH
jgi:hypothetical protein